MEANAARTPGSPSEPVIGDGQEHGDPSPPAPGGEPAAPVGRAVPRAFKLAGAAFVVLTVLGLTSIQVTSMSGFCGSTCHLMEPFYESWKSSSHNQVACVECHIPPGTESYVWAKLNGAGQVVDDLLHRTSTKPSASINDMSCMRSGCHQEKNLGTARADLPYRFRHADHLGLEYAGIEIHCSTCHSHVKGNKHMEVNTNTCLTCHRTPQNGVVVASDEHAPGSHPGAPHAGEAPSASPDALEVTSEATDLTPAPDGALLPVAGRRQAKRPAPAGCGDCHDAPQKPFEHEGVTINHPEFERYSRACESCHRGASHRSSPVTDAQCLACHIDGLGDQPVNVVEMHRTHTMGEHKVECFSCHGLTDHRKETTGVYGQLDCVLCHDQTQAHTVQRANYQEGGFPAPGVDVTFLNPMLLAHVDCSGCHVRKNGSAVARPSPEACDACHRPGLGAEQIALWQKSTRRLYDELRLQVPQPEAMAVGPEGDLHRRVHELLEVVRADGSWGVHNPKYTEALLLRARAILYGSADDGAAAEAHPGPTGETQPPPEAGERRERRGEGRGRQAAPQ